MSVKMSGEDERALRRRREDGRKAGSSVRSTAMRIAVQALTSPPCIAPPSPSAPSTAFHRPLRRPRPASLRASTGTDDVDVWALVLWVDDKVLHKLTPETRRELLEAASVEPRQWAALNTVRAPHTHPPSLTRPTCLQRLTAPPLPCATVRERARPAA